MLHLDGNVDVYLRGKFRAAKLVVLTHIPMQGIWTVQRNKDTTVQQINNCYWGNKGLSDCYGDEPTTEHLATKYANARHILMNRTERKERQEQRKETRYK
jgi:hypothetical protein